MSKKIWLYILWPVILLNTIPVCLFGAVFAVAYQRGGNAQSVDLTQPLFWLYVAIFLINWGLALFVFWKLKREGESVRDLIAVDGNPCRFNWKPALILFLVFNSIWVIYVNAYAWLAGQWPSYSGLEMWQKIIFIGLFPISAGFTEELFWRGFIITQLEAVRQSSKRAILFSAIGFALVHGIFFPDRLASTFLLGLVAGSYYVRERKLLPLMLTHAFMDIWSYGLSLFAG
jgi:membrane protease YdiL (CAAX protease family)